VREEEKRKKEEALMSRQAGKRPRFTGSDARLQDKVPCLGLSGVR
jgi:hypothetical protein